MPVGQGDTKHGAGKHLCHVTSQFYWLFFRHKTIEPSNVAAGGRKINFFQVKKQVDNRRLFAKFPPTMKSDTLNGVLTFVLLVLVLAGVILALNVTFQTRTLRAMQQRALVSKFNLERVQAVFNDTKAYYQKKPTPELARILQSVQTKTPNSSPTPTR